LEVVKPDEPSKRLEAILRASLTAMSPTPKFRRQAWREFQRALDPLAAPRPMPRERA